MTAPTASSYSLSRKEGWFQMVTAPLRRRPELLTIQQLRRIDDAERAAYDETRFDWHANLGPFTTPQLARIHDELSEVVASNRQDGDRVRKAPWPSTASRVSARRPWSTASAAPTSANRSSVTASAPATVTSVSQCADWGSRRTPPCERSTR